MRRRWTFLLQTVCLVLLPLIPRTQGIVQYTEDSLAFITGPITTPFPPSSSSSSSPLMANPSQQNPQNLNYPAQPFHSDPSSVQAKRTRLRSISNNFAPIFTLPINNIFTIPDTTTVGTLVCVVSAYIPSSQNSNASNSNNFNSPTYSLLSGGADFFIDSHNGNLYVAQSLVGLSASPLTVVVQASDNQQPVANTSFLELLVFLQKLDYPHFLNNQGGQASLLEYVVARNSSEGTPITTLSAYDDFIANHTLLRYSLLPCTAASASFPTDGFLSLNAVTGVLAVNHSLLALEGSSLHCAVTVLDSSNPKRNSTISLTVKTSSLYVRATFAICGVRPENVAVNSNSQITTLLSTSIASYLAVSNTSVRFVSSGPEVMNTSRGYCSNAALFTQMQPQVYCYDIASCNALASALSELLISPSFLKSLNIDAQSKGLAGVFNISFIAVDLNATIISPAQVEPSPQHAPVLTTAALYLDYFSVPLSASAIASQSGLDWDGSNLTLAIFDLGASISKGSWIVVEHNITSRNRTSSHPPIITNLSSWSNISLENAIIVSGSGQIQFIPSSNYHGAAFIKYKIMKDLSGSSSFASRAVIWMNVSSGAFESYGSFSQASGTAVTVIFPSPNTAPTISSLGLSPLSPTPLLQRTNLNFGSQWAVSSIIPTSLIVDSALRNELLLLSSTSSFLLAIIPTIIQTDYARAVEYYNEVAQRRSILLQSGQNAGIGVLESSGVEGAWQYILTERDPIWTPLSSSVGGTAYSSITPFSPSPIQSFAKVTLLPSDAVIRFVPNALAVSGNATLQFYLWDAVQGSPGMDIPLGQYPGAFSLSTFLFDLPVVHINSRPMAVTSTVTMPTIPYTITEDNFYVTVFHLSMTTSTFNQRVTSFLQSVSLITQSSVELINILSEPSG